MGNSKNREEKENDKGSAENKQEIKPGGPSVALQQEGRPHSAFPPGV